MKITRLITLILVAVLAISAFASCDLFTIGEDPADSTLTLELYIDGELYDTVTANRADEELSLPEAEEKEGYSFTGWCLDESCEIPFLWNDVKDNTSETVKVYGKYVSESKDTDCRHDWSNGACLSCGTACKHSWQNGVCSYCGTACSHSWQNGVCVNCADECEHNLVDGKCTVCLIDCAHTYADSVCLYCGNKCEHAFEGDTCIYCGFTEKTTPPDCAHEWQDGYCPSCGNTCQHSYTGSTCDVCGTECHHVYWAGGYCNECGKPCEHVWNGDYCEKCGFTCMHEGSWSNGKCAVCGKQCEHMWNLTQCEHCGLICNHVFDGATCTSCGYMSGGIDNPICVTYDNAQYYLPYSAIFREFVSMYLTIDYDESIRGGYWVAVTEDGDVRINEDTPLSSFGHEVTVALRANSSGDCSHSWYEGACVNCGTVCSHSWYEGACVNCGTVCSHSWYEGACASCKKNCEHDFKGDTCMICGYVSADTAYSVELQFEDVTTGEYVRETYYFSEAPTGADVIEKLGRDVSLYTVYYNYSYCDYASFLPVIISGEYNSVSFIPNRVLLHLYITDENGVEILVEHEGYLELELDEILANYQYGYTKTLRHPDGSESELADGSSACIRYTPDNSKEGMDYRYCEYTLVVVCNAFKFEICVDGYDLTPTMIDKSDEMTLGEILAAYYDLEYDNYDWWCQSDGSIALSKDYVPDAGIYIVGNDNRPYIEASIDGVSYKAYHTESLTLTDAIELINRTHGISVEYGDYVWYAYNESTWRSELVTDPSIIVVGPGYSRTVVAKTLTSVTVEFYTDFGPVYDTDGIITEYVFAKDGVWQTPTISENALNQTTYGIVRFTGEYEYRVYDDSYNVIERYDVNSIDELFALNLPTVTLYAKYEVDHERLSGTYQCDSYIIVINENTISYFSRYDYQIYADLDYTVEPLYGNIGIRDGHGCTFDGYYFDEYCKMSEDELLIVVFTPFDTVEYFSASDDYNDYVQHYVVRAVTDIYGNSVDSVADSGLYFVYTEEMPEE